MLPDRSTSRSESDAGNTEPVTVELYVRSLSESTTKAPQEAVLERLSELEREGIVDEYTVHVWGRRISPDTAAANTGIGQFVLSRIESFRDWARRSGLSIGSFFDTHEVHSSITDESYTAITVPSITLAEFHGEEVRRVTPCSDGETIHTVDDHLDILDAVGRGNCDEADGSPRKRLLEGSPD